MAVISTLISQVVQYLRILGSVVAEGIVCIDIITGNRKGNHRTIFKNRADNTTICRVKSFSTEYNFHFSRPQQTLIKGEQRLVDLKDVVFLLPDEILDDDVELAAGAEGVARTGNEVTGLVQIQFQRDGEGDGRGLRGLVVRIVANLGKELTIHIAFL